MLALIVVSGTHFSTSCFISCINLRWHSRTLLIICTFFDFWIHTIIGLQFLIITIQSRTIDTLSLLSYLGLWLIRVYLSKMIILF